MQKRMADDITKAIEKLREKFQLRQMSSEVSFFPRQSWGFGDLNKPFLFLALVGENDTFSALFHARRTGDIPMLVE